MSKETIAALVLALLTWLAPESRALAQAEATVELAAPNALGAEDGGSTEPTWWLVGVGGGVFLADYLFEIVLTAATGGTAQEVERVAIPLVGTWLELAESPDLPWWEVGLGIYEGVMQVAALTAMVIGLAWQQPTGADEPAETTVAITPTVLPGGGGLAALGTFR